MKKQFDIPILFIIFRRKDTALQVIDAIAKVKPKKLYISQDGPRNEEEKREILETRKAVLSRINWDCDLVFWKHETNLGLINHTPDALDRIFKKEKYCVYLEDDTLPSIYFFKFQSELLPKFANDKRIFSINGVNFFPDKLNLKHSYYLTQIPSVWGCGFYRRSWRLYKKYNFEFRKRLSLKGVSNFIFSEKYKFYIDTFIRAINENKLNSWAIQINYALVTNKMYSISPKLNLVNNIGFFSDKASNKTISSYYQKTENIFPLVHPEKIVYVKKNDIIYFDNLLKGGWLRLYAIRFYLLSPRLVKSIIVFFVNILNKFN